MIRILFIILCLFQLQQKQAQIYINEIQASNDTTLTGNFLEYDDWFELYNPTNSPINLAGYYLSDNIFQLTKFQIPNINASATTIPANGHLLFWADDDIAQGVNHCNFKLSASGETVFLVAPDGVPIIDSLTYVSIGSNQTFKRIPDGSSNVIKSNMSSPANTNNTDIGLLEPPIFSIAPGVYSNTQTVALSATSEAAIYYTTNGAEPDLNSTVYSGPITISQNITIKAIAVQSSFASSEVVSASYFTNANHTLPIVNISIDQAHLFDNTLGMYTEGKNGTLGGCNTTANWWNDFEYPAHITLFEKDGSVGFNEIAGVEISGGCSRNKDKKALNVGFKSENDLAGGVWSWTGPNNFSSNQQEIIVSDEGLYTVTYAKDGFSVSTEMRVYTCNETIIPFLMIEGVTGWYTADTVDISLGQTVKFGPSIQDFQNSNLYSFVAEYSWTGPIILPLRVEKLR